MEGKNENRELENDMNAMNIKFWKMCTQLDVKLRVDYEKDWREKQYFDICLIKIQNAELIYLYKGFGAYLKQLQCSIEEVNKFLADRKCHNQVSAYFINYDAIALIKTENMGEDEFIKLTKKMCKRFQFYKSDLQDTPFLLRFSVVLNQKNPLSIAVTQLEDTQIEQCQYLLFSEDKKEGYEKINDLAMLDTLSHAIQHDGVVPFYQGIYNNNQKKITKYEALMRIRGEDGKIYTPFHFMDISKKYSLYTTLNRIMFQKVIADVNKYDFLASVNISAHDVNNNVFRKHIYEVLREKKKEKNLIIEILEDEVFQDVELLKEFVRDMAEFNVKIALDDFGVGYSNLYQIGAIAPQYIKLDGKIIRQLVEPENYGCSRAIIQSVRSIADYFNAELVAEYVEKKELQDEIEKLNIEFSQGYYYSKPDLIENIQDIVSPNKEVCL